MLGTILNVLTPVFFSMLLGYYAGRKKIVDNQNVKTLNVFVMMFALPAALFVATIQTPRQVILEHGPLILVLAATMLIVFFFNLYLQLKVFKLNLAESSVETLTVALPNYASVGLPLLGSIFGPESAITVAIAIAVGAVVMSPLTLVLLETGTPQSTSGSPVSRFMVGLMRSCKRPLVLGPVLGVILSFAGVTLPPALSRSINLLGQTTAGSALFLTGLILSREALSIDWNVTIGVVLKNIIQPIITLGIVLLLRFPPRVAQEAVLLTAIPAGFFGVVFGAGYNVRSREAGLALLWSSVLSMATLAITILLLPYIK